MKRWPLQKAYFWERAPFFRLLLPLVAGIIIYQYLHAITPIYIIFPGLLSFLGIVLLSFVRQQHAVVKTTHFALLNITMIATGWFLCYNNDASKKSFSLGNAKAQSYLAVLTNEPAEKEKTWKLEVDVINGIENNKVTNITGKAFVYVYKNSMPVVFHEGDTIILPDKWQAIKTAGNPFEFDYARYCALNNTYYQQFLALDDIILYEQAKPNDLSLIRQAHKWCMQQLSLYIPDKPTLGLMQAMLIGDEANMDPDLRKAYSETGIIHIVAISGSHITIFFFIISFLLGWIKHKKWNWVKYVAAIPLVWVYVLMSGASPSAVRAALMFSILGLGFATQKQANGLNQLLATAFLLLLAEPNWLFATGFQLSFLAVLSLILFYRPISKLYTPANKITKGVWSAIAASVAAELLVAPLVVYYFHLFPLLFIVANVVAYLFMGAVLVLGMLIVLLSGIPSIAAIIADVITCLVKLFNEIVYTMQDINPASFSYLDAGLWELILLYITVGTVAIFLLQKKKAALFTALSSVCLFMILLCADEWEALHQRKIAVYNISGGNHIELMEGKYHYVLYSDIGINSKNKNYVLKPAHTGFHAWRNRIYTKQNDMLLIGGKSLLILNEPIYNSESYPVDYLIVNYKSKEVDPIGLKKTFNPKKIVLGSNLPRKLTQEWIMKSNQQHIVLHAVSENGAFVL